MRQETPVQPRLCWTYHSRIKVPGCEQVLIRSGPGRIYTRYQWAPFPRMVLPNDIFGSANDERDGSKTQVQERGLLLYGDRNNNGRWQTRYTSATGIICVKAD